MTAPCHTMHKVLILDRCACEMENQCKCIVTILMCDISGPGGSTHLHITSIFHVIDRENICISTTVVIVLHYFTCSGKHKQLFPLHKKTF